MNRVPEYLEASSLVIANGKVIKNRYGATGDEITSTVADGYYTDTELLLSAEKMLKRRASASDQINRLIALCVYVSLCAAVLGALGGFIMAWWLYG
jgi:hypothetical protein